MYVCMYVCMAWYMVYGIWYMVYGIRYKVYGVWCMVYGIVCMHACMYACMCVCADILLDICTTMTIWGLSETAGLTHDSCQYEEQKS